MFSVSWTYLLQRMLLLLTVALSLCGSVAAQTPGGSEPPPAGADNGQPAEPPKPPARVVETGPVTHYLEDAEGNLQPVIDMKFEDFERLWKLDRRLTGPDQPDRYSIQQWTATGVVRDSWVELDIALKLEITVKHWCRVPLGLNKAVLTEAVQHEGPGRFFLGVDPNTGDYVCWFRGGEGDTHTLQLKVHAPLEQVLGESRLRLRVPQAATSRLTLILKSAQVTTVTGAKLLPTEPRDEGGTVVTLAGLSESVQVSWRKGKVTPPRATTVLEAKGVVVVRVEGLNAITTEALLQVQSSNGPMKSFRVRLPADTDPKPAKQPGYEIVEVTGPNRKSNGGARTNMVEVRLTQPTSDPVEVKLFARQELDKVRANSQVEIGLVEVVDAVRQSGVIALQVTGEASVKWVEGEGVVRVDTLPPEVPRENTVAGFEYSQQPCSLKLKVLPEETWIGVEPQYLLDVGADVVRLRAQLSYNIRGPKTDGVEVSMAGWQLDAVEPAALVKLDALQPDQLSPLVIHLAEPTNGPVKIEIRAHCATRPMPKPILWPKLLGSPLGDVAIAVESAWRNRQEDQADGEQSPIIPLAFPLPHPMANGVNPAAVVLLPDDNVQITPLPGASRGLRGDPNPPQMELPQRAQAPLFYQTLVDNRNALFVGDLQVLRRRVSVDQETGVSLQENVAHVTQRIRYHIAHEGLDYLLLHLPADLTRKEGFSLECDGAAVETDLLTVEETPDGGAELPHVRLPLAGSRIGVCEVAVSYTVPVDQLDHESPMELTIPLVVPIADVPPAVERNRPLIDRLLMLFADDPQNDQPSESFLDRVAALFADDPPVSQPIESFVYRGHTLTVDVTSPMQIESPGGTWVALDRTAGDVDGDDRFFSDTPTDEVVLNLVVRKPRNGGAAIATRAWVQTWLNSNGRRDRASFRVRTGGKPIQIRLPAGADTSKVQLFVDGVPREWRDADQLEMTVPLAGGVDSREHLVELFYTLEPGRSTPGGMSFELPQVAGVDWVKRIYWQIVLPGDEELVAAPPGLTPEAIWGWHGVRWGNRPRLNTKDLELWMDTSRSSQVPAGASEYLFSSFGPVETVALRTTNRSLIVLLASGIVLVVGLIWIYVPFVRRAWLVLLAIVVFAFFALAYPEPAIFMAQAAVLGLALAIVARQLYWVVIERRIAKGIVHGTAFFTADRSTTQTQPRYVEGSSHGGSATVPAIPAGPPPESGT